MFRRWSSSIHDKKTIEIKERNMAHKISADCTMCGACVDVCPVEAISEGDPKYIIDPELCTDCGACIDECPVEAISAE